MGRNGVALGLVALLAVALVASASLGTLPKADFTFCNATDVKSLDPAKVTGQPEGRVISALFEGLVSWKPDTLEPIPGVAESWELSEDGLTYTFHLRKNARWSNGDPLTAHDFQYSFRRFLDPQTAAEYAYQLWYVRGAKAYTTQQLVVGQQVEVELPPADPLPPGMRPFGRGPVLYGTLQALDGAAPAEAGAPDTRVYTVEIDGQARRFALVPADSELELCKQVLPDFREVGVRVIDDHTLELTLEHPTPYFVFLLGFYVLSPVHQECVETYGDSGWVRPEHIVTNGPYKLEFRRLRDRIRLARNEHYWDAANVRLATIDVLAVESDTTLLNLYLTGAADWIPTVPNIVIPQLKQERSDFISEPILAVYFYRLNTTRPPLDDVRVRRALSLALNREEIVTRVSRGGESPARCFVPPGLNGYPKLDVLREDVDQARALLAEAGFGPDRPLPAFAILYNTSEAHRDIAQVVMYQWKSALGVDARLRNQEWQSYLASQRSQDYEVSRSGWTGDYADPNTFLDLFVTDGENNQTGWGNPRYDELIAEAARETDAAARLALLAEAERILLDEVPIIPLYHYMSKNLVHPNLRGFYPNTLDVHPLQALYWSNDAAAPADDAQPIAGAPAP